MIGKTGEAMSHELPSISVIIPTHNEEKTIGAMLRNTLDLNYPVGKLEILVVDGASTDGTRKIVQQYADESRVRLVTQESRSGWNSGVQEGVDRAKGDIIVLSGSDVFYDRDAMARLCSHFDDPQVGAVTGRQLLFNSDETFAAQMESEYRRTQDFVSAAESILDQPFDVKGEIVAVRKWILNAAIARTRKAYGAQDAWTGTLDVCVAFETKAQGKELIFEPEATYSEYAPASMRERVRMQVRRAKVLIESTSPYLWMIFEPRFGRFGMLIFPYHFLMLTILPWILLLGLMSICIAALSNPYYLILFVPIIVVVVPKKGRVLLSSFVIAQISLVLATCLVATRKTLLIKTIKSTRRLPERRAETGSSNNLNGVFPEIPGYQMCFRQVL
jgi:cellulose synthase/poly-beta-1,6-N-acetylglucosamine synthase-like glycosyltransferase